MKSGEKYEQMESVKKEENDEPPSHGEDPELELMKNLEHDVKQTDGEDGEMELENKAENAYDGEDPETELMKKCEHDVKQNDGEDDEELVPLRKLVNDLESRVEAAKSALELIKRIDKVGKEEPIAATILPIKASFGDESTSSVSYLKNKEISLRDEYTLLIVALRRELKNIDVSVSVATQKKEETYIAEQELSKIAEALENQKKENLHLTCKLAAQDLKEKELNKLADDLKKQKEVMLDQLIAKEKIINENEKELKQVANQERVMLSTLSDKENAIKKLNEELSKLNVALMKHEMENANLLEQAAQDFDDLKKQKEVMLDQLISKEKIIKGNKEELKKAANQERVMVSTLYDKETFIQKLNEDLSKLREDLKEHEIENANLLGQLASKDEILKNHEETLPMIIQNSPLQTMYDSIPECMQTCLAPKGSITGDELGTFMGSLVSTAAYNVTFSNSDLKKFLIWNSFANLMGSMFGQICNNIVTHISHTEMGKNWFKEAFKIIGKSVFWIFLGGLIPMLAGGLIKAYGIRLAVTAAAAFAMQCGAATLWKMSYKISMWQPIIIVLLGIVGIGIAAGIPHYFKVASEKK